ncbi:MAG: YitT family protein [Leptospiraceae bacterium]|nr:YitT family protein [Leptospiraceae bacterium]MCB1303474.1 YitT family protein [Leptospiraceae bacterium]
MKTILRRTILTVLGVLSATVGLKSFLIPNEFLDGGVTGISLLLNLIQGWDISILIVVFNVPFLLLGIRNINARFALQSLVSILALALALRFLELPAVTSDKLLVSGFGGFFLGAGIGLCIRGGSVLDGTEIMALYLSKRTSLSVSDVILIVNIALFGVAALIVDIDRAMYAILTYLAASKTVDFIIHGVEEYTALTIISDHSDAIRKMLTEKLGLGVTLFQGKKGFSRSEPSDPHSAAADEISIVYTVLTRLEVAGVRADIEQIDPSAFIIQSVVDETRGGMIKKRSDDHF